MTYHKVRCKVTVIKSKGAVEILQSAFLFIHINTLTGTKKCTQREVPSLRCIFCSGKRKGGDFMYSATDVIWVLVAAILVFFMQAGFALCEAGLTRAKNTGNILMKNMMAFHPRIP